MLKIFRTKNIGKELRQLFEDQKRSFIESIIKLAEGRYLKTGYVIEIESFLAFSFLFAIGMGHDIKTRKDISLAFLENPPLNDEIKNRYIETFQHYSKIMNNNNYSIVDKKIMKDNGINNLQFNVVTLGAEVANRLGIGNIEDITTNLGNIFWVTSKPISNLLIHELKDI